MKIKQKKLSETSKSKNLTIKLDEPLFLKVDEKILYKKYKEKKGITKQKWITAAIKAKLAHDKKSVALPLKKKRFINYKFDEELSQELEQHLSDLKKVDSSYSLGRWISEAILMQLEKEGKS